MLSRRGAVALTIFAMSMSILVMLGVEHVRQQTKTSFASSISGVDLIVGTRTGTINLLLYSVFRIGSATDNVSWQAYKRLSQHSSVRWSVPISLGDSHKGYRVLGTTSQYFEHYNFGKKQAFTFNNGEKFTGIFDVVLGAHVAKQLGYQLGDKITLSHGIGSTSFKNHDKSPFQVTGILNATGTPVDKTLHVSLQGLEAVHMPFTRLNQLTQTPHIDDFKAKQLTPKSVTAILIGLHSKMAVFSLQRKINTDNNEPLTAIIPGIALAELWRTMSPFENTLRLISGLVFISSLIALSAILLSSIRERIMEVKLLRMIGAPSSFVFWLIELEAMIIAMLSTAIALGALSLVLILSKEIILTRYGIIIEGSILSSINKTMVFTVFLFAFFAAIPPAFIAFSGAKNSYT